jgi:hypothetical protein
MMSENKPENAPARPAPSAPAPDARSSASSFTRAVNPYAAARQRREQTAPPAAQT